MTDLTPAGILAPVWLKASDYDAIIREERTLPGEITVGTKSNWITEQITTMTRVSLTS